MKSFTPTAESHDFSPYLMWSGLLSGCRATKFRRSRSESAKLSGTPSLSAVFVADWRDCPWGSIVITDNEWSTFLFTSDRDR